MALREYILSRVLQTGITIIAALVINFVIFRMVPGNPARFLIQDPRIGPAEVKRLTRLFGLDQPLHVQLLYYFINVFRGDFGTSFVYKEPVMNVIAARFANTMILVLSATLIAIAVGVTLGSFGAWKRGSKSDVLSLSVSLFLYSMPSFWLGMIAILLFAVYYGIFPSSGVGTLTGLQLSNYEVVLDYLHHLALPTTVLSMAIMGEFALIHRTSMLDVLSEDYILTAKAKGLGGARVLRDHAMRNAMLPTFSLIALFLGYAVGGAIQVEAVFSWPGLGSLMYQSFFSLDYPMLQGVFLIFSISVIVTNFAADIVIAYLDPRIRF